MKNKWKIIMVMMVAGSSILYWNDGAKAFHSVTAGKYKIGTKNSVKGAQDINASIKVLNRWELPDILKEVSGMEYLGNNRFACIQDELGTLFIYNTASGTIEKEIPFTGPGDFEGLAIVGTTAYAVQSDGVIFEAQHYQSAKPEVKQYKTELTAKHNVEGLTYDKNNNRLLLAIKGEEPNSSEYKGIYAFDIKDKQFLAEPVYKINLADPIFGGVKEKKKKNTFQPSEIEVHPVTNDIYVLEGANPKLLVMDSNGNKKKLYTMQKSQFPQAEGLVITPAGELFISNEGKSGAATIVKVVVE